MELEMTGAEAALMAKVDLRQALRRGITAASNSGRCDFCKTDLGTEVLLRGWHRQGPWRNFRLHVSGLPHGARCTLWRGIWSAVHATNRWKVASVRGVLP